MASQFISNSTVTYDVAIDGTTIVTHDITLQNATSDFYATSYTLSLTGVTAINPLAYEGNVKLPVQVSQDKDITNIVITFPDAVVGKGNTRKFNITFVDRTIAVKTGDIWEVTTPKLGDATSFDFYSTILKIPNSFGNLAYVSPNPTFNSQEAGKKVYSFDKDASTKTTVTAAFGQFQVFSYDLTYHLENPLNQNVETDIALPPDTSYQKMNYTKIDPLPTKIDIDSDGNWIATFALKPQQKVDVKVQGAVQLFADPIKFSNTTSLNVSKDLGQSQYWEINDPQIKLLASQLKTPMAIYNYVISTLTYNYARVAPNVQRLGAAEALQSPTNAICTEFTDLFIAIARAAGIPAREIEGFAYTDNPSLQPLSLVADVLHAWPEYWDDTRETWIPVDPTWGATSKIDYFSKLDLRHFAFVVHGSDSTKPYPAGSYKLGVNPQKDVSVTFGSLPALIGNNLQVENKIISQIPFGDEIVNVRVKNLGPTAAYNVSFKVKYDNAKIATDRKIDAVVPYGFYDTTLDIPYSFLGQKTPQKVEILLNDSTKSEITTYKQYLIISNLLLLSLFVFFILFLIYLKFRDAKAKKHTGESGSIPLQE